MNTFRASRLRVYYYLGHVATVAGLVCNLVGETKNAEIPITF